MKYYPMLCQMGSKQFLSNKNYIFEIKLDGTRIILYKEKNKISLKNRKGTEKDWQYPELENLSKLKPNNFVLDGEIVIYDENGLPDFELFLKREQSTRKPQIDDYSIRYPATYVAYDILELNGKSTVNLSLEERKKILHKNIKESEIIELSFETHDGEKLWKEVVKRNLEGVIAKKKGSIYRQGERSRDWLKIKNIKTVDVVIVGFTSDIRKMSSLAMGVYVKGELNYIGRVGTGFSEKKIDELYDLLKPLKTEEMPAANDPRVGKIQWVKPKLVAEVEFLRVTPDRQLRAPVFLRLRGDKTPKQCTWEGQL